MKKLRMAQQLLEDANEAIEDLEKLYDNITRKSGLFYYF